VLDAGWRNAFGAWIYCPVRLTNSLVPEEFVTDPAPSAFGMRLGEGSGATLAFVLQKAAIATTHGDLCRSRGQRTKLILFRDECPPVWLMGLCGYRLVRAMYPPGTMLRGGKDKEVGYAKKRHRSRCYRHRGLPHLTGPDE
jgi:hypothetical protein